jgi:1-acyl-sn-glycerol-3-phosphate acyltransferase
LSLPDPIIPPMPASLPQVPPSRFSRWFGRTVLRLGGWHMRAPFPVEGRAVVVFAPHSSNWDGLWGLAAKLGMGVDARILAKSELFWWPLGILLRRIGVVPLNRASPQGTVGQAVALIKASEKIWYVLAPEGTRKVVKDWKGGFIKIAHQAQVPIIPAYIHYPDRVIGFGPPIRTTGDFDADMATVRAFYRQWQGRNRGAG